ncbi:hypothetical protein HanRHA438_Chr15g0707151 [Helianthus annuus]|nr:hypothetical protein HanRHA438_Chr15g0707151 [Helianthus annuus]
MIFHVFLRNRLKNTIFHAVTLSRNSTKAPHSLAWREGACSDHPLTSIFRATRHLTLTPSRGAREHGFQHNCFLAPYCLVTPVFQLV